MVHYEEVTIESEVLLKGALLLPETENKVPAVLIINGSGGADRDGNLFKPKLPFNLYKSCHIKKHQNFGKR
ncbi:hypothetical protein RZN25_04490 [Bacillaceae bacterium S4-13-56]